MEKVSRQLGELLVCWRWKVVVEEMRNDHIKSRFRR